MRNIQPILDRFLSFPRWKWFSERRNSLELVAEALLPFFEEKIQPLSGIIDLTKPFTMEDFYKVCEAKNIRLYESKDFPFRVKNSKKGEALGFFCYDINGSPTIWIKERQSKKSVLHTAAHEISHYLLGHLLNGTRLPTSPLFQKNEKAQESIISEMEADLMAAFLLTLEEVSK